MPTPCKIAAAAIGPVADLLSVTGHQDQCLKVFGCSLIATILLNLVLAPAYGILGAAITVLLVTVGTGIWLHALVLRHIGIQPSVLGTGRASH